MQVLKRNKKAFILIDALVMVFVVVIVVEIVFLYFTSVNNFEKGVKNFEEKDLEFYKEVFKNIDCQKSCSVDKNDDSDDDSIFDDSDFIPSVLSN